MSEPLEFKAEAEALWRALPLYIGSPTVEEIDRIDRALREAAAKALQSFRDYLEPQRRSLMGDVGALATAWCAILDTDISALRTPSAPNAPR